MRQHVQTQQEWEAEMSEKILSYVRDALYLELRHLGPALSGLHPTPQEQLITTATDGTQLYFPPEPLIRLFRENETYLNRLYLHSILHCLFGHLWIRGGRDRLLWQVACDITVEYVMDHLKKPCVHRIIGWLRQKTYRELEDGTVSAAIVYRYLQEKDEDEIRGLYQEFLADDHRYWPRDGQESSPEMAMAVRNRWNQMARQTQLEQKRNGDESDEGQQLFQAQMETARKKRSYRDFLRKFSVFREELHLSDEEFDAAYYTYGLERYGNMPLIEPVETREVSRIQDFVVAVDTSYSTSGELVQGFLQETFDILTERDNFFHHARIWVLQCDERVQREDVIRRREDMERLFQEFEILGGGGTDFRPVFTYVESLLSQGKFDHLCGLLYFTDGKGIYPRKKPVFKTAFLFLEDYEEDGIPPWAMRMQLGEEELRGRDRWRHAKERERERTGGAHRNEYYGSETGD